MPDGRVMRIDHDRDCVYIVRRGRGYEAALAEVEPAARVPSARVNFRLRREGGQEVAEQVKLRTGGRTSKRQRRFGDLTGARQPGAKVWTTAQGAFGIDVTTQPFRVVGAWLQAIEDQDFDGAVSLYRPGAVVHASDRDVSGRKQIRALVERCRPTHDDEATELHGVDRYIRAGCLHDDEALTTFFSVENGQITEQWLGSDPGIEAESPGSCDIEVVLKGDVDASAVDYARRKLEQVAATMPVPAESSRLKLTEASNPQIHDSAMAEASIEADGSLLRAHAAAPTMTEAVDLVVARLRSRLEHRSDRERHKPTGRPSVPGEWRRGNLPSTHPPYFHRQADERELVRHKSFAPDEMTIEEAAWDMGLLDYDFFLFVETMSGADSLLARDGEGLLHLHQLETDRDVGLTAEPELPPEVERTSTPTPNLGVSEAIGYLNQTEGRSLFFKNSASTRGNVVYRRYDGHYGLITPPVDDPDR